jgi:hypothetical protein
MLQRSSVQDSSVLVKWYEARQLAGPITLSSQCIDWLISDETKEIKMKTNSSRFFVTLAVCGVVLVLAAPGSAQRRRGYAGSGYTRPEVDRLIKRTEDRTDVFVKLFDKALDNSVLDGTQKEDRLNDKAKELEKQMDKVRKEFDHAEGYIEIKEHVAKALVVSEEINTVVINRRLNSPVAREWALLRVELNKLARVYNLGALKLDRSN